MDAPNSRRQYRITIGAAVVATAAVVLGVAIIVLMWPALQPTPLPTPVQASTLSSDNHVTAQP